MTRPEKSRELFTASDVAQFCQVDLKTIHNWADRDEIRHFRTPGRHLRFRRTDVLDFLRRFGYPVPDILIQGRPRVIVVDQDAHARTSTEHLLAPEFDVTGFEDVVDALVHIGAEVPDAVVLTDPIGGLTVAHVLARLRDMEATRHVRVLVFSASTNKRRKLLDAGAFAVVDTSNADELRTTLQSLLGQPQ